MSESSNTTIGSEEDEYIGGRLERVEQKLMWEDRWCRGGPIAALLFIGIAVLIAGHHDRGPQWPPFMADGPTGYFPPLPMWGGAGGYGAYGGGSGPYGDGRPPWRRLRHRPNHPRDNWIPGPWPAIIRLPLHGTPQRHGHDFLKEATGSVEVHNFDRRAENFRLVLLRHGARALSVIQRSLEHNYLS